MKSKLRNVPIRHLDLSYKYIILAFKKFIPPYVEAKEYVALQTVANISGLSLRSRSDVLTLSFWNRPFSVVLDFYFLS